ncbi:MAG: hypothetical protein EOP06_24810, partial [Proteobacteria bacterium]
MLPPAVQVADTWEELLSGRYFWTALLPQARILSLFRALAEETEIPDIPPATTEADLRVRCVLYLYYANGKDAHTKGVAFAKAHDAFVEFVTSEAWKSDKMLDMTPLLPNCVASVLVDYCEGRAWPEPPLISSQNAYNTGLSLPVLKAFCPRTSRPCGTIGPDGTRTPTDMYSYGARLYADRSLDWSQWSMNELLSATGVNIPTHFIKRDDLYVTGLAGWVNRLNEIRARMRCSVCKEIMIADAKYAYNLAVYNKTVMICRDGHESVYLNHCWACRRIIDSRESSIKDEGYYLCIGCGSGPRNPTTFTQGDTCPKCGEKAMQQLSHDDRRRRVCRSPRCGHII